MGLICSQESSSKWKTTMKYILANNIIGSGSTRETKHTSYMEENSVSSLSTWAVLERNFSAFLFPRSMTVSTGQRRTIQFIKGLHLVTDIHYLDCQEVLDWKYKRTYEESWKYKEGNFIFEKVKIACENW